LTIELLNMDNMLYKSNKQFDIIYCDMIYENMDFSYVDKFWTYLKPNGIFCIQTDFHSAAEIKVYTQQMPNAYFLNWLIWKNEFGNFRKDRFRMCHDDILLFCNGNSWVWHPEKIQVPKITSTAKGLNPSGRDTKLATSVITDICLTTVSKERVKKEDGKLIRWQKPLKLYARILEPFIDETHKDILDPFMGSGSLGKYCKEKDYNYVGIEYDETPFNLAKKNIYG
jgi:DNA modification methylase